MSKFFIKFQENKPLSIKTCFLLYLGGGLLFLGVFKPFKPV